MKKDIEIPISKDVLIAVVQSWNEDFQENSWYAYLVNNTDDILEMVLIVSKAYGTIDGESRKTSTFRHGFEKVAPKSYIKIELLENSVLELNNKFQLTYFIGNKIYEKSFVFPKNSINPNATRNIPIMNQKGILVK